jgi:predicted transcriptional regulator of viral defense system
MTGTTHPAPVWDALFDLAAGQAGLFTAGQAGAVGFSAQLLAHHVRSGRITRVLRSVYRVLHFPGSDEEASFAAWLWSERAGVIGGETALAWYELVDPIPREVTLLVPLAWGERRLRVPPNIVLDCVELPAHERAWFGALPITTPARTLNDCARHALLPNVLREACARAVRRGLVTRGELAEVARALEPFGGFAA